MSPFLAGVSTFLCGMLAMTAVFRLNLFLSPLLAIENAVHKALPRINPDSYLRLALTITLYVVLTLILLTGLHWLLQPELNLAAFYVLTYLGAFTALWLRLHIE